jgi:4-hydroxy-tetrahydrodipicolinate reductase
MGKSVQLVVCGAAGRMGQAVLRLASESTDLAIAAALVRPGVLPEVVARNSRTGWSYATSVPAALEADVVVDFSGSAGFDAALELAVGRRLALVSGSTGLSDAQRATLLRASTEVPVLWAANFSAGIAVLAHLVEQAARLLPDWDCEIIEAHHRHKRDAPSGTALMLGERARQARAGALADAMPDRSGLRCEGSIGYAVIRAGDIVGEHEVRLAGPGERVELIHRASDRDVFARGALQAARWLAGRGAGCYLMSDVLGLKPQPE